jgi:glycosyltransferase involved in cell wall biosynthesis
MFNADRGLLELVSSVAKWSPNMRLTLRGFGAPSMEQRLRDAANEAGVTDRVRFEPRAPMLELVALANQSDVGIHPIPVANQQTNLCLPNKFFEYVMAGLAVCVSDAREMAQLTHNYDVGVTFESSDAGSIANAVNSLTPARVEAFKRSALEAAKELNWEHEKLKLLDVYRSLR